MSACHDLLLEFRLDFCLFKGFKFSLVTSKVLPWINPGLVLGLVLGLVQV